MTMYFSKWLEIFDYENELPKMIQTKLDLENYRVLVVDVAKFDAAWSQDTGFYLPPGGKGENYIRHPSVDNPKRNRYDVVGEEIPKFKAAGMPFHMPTVALKYGNIPAFVDGRHRFAYFRDMGLKTLPVSVEKESYKKFKALFGAN